MLWARLGWLWGRQWSPPHKLGWAAWRGFTTGCSHNGPCSPKKIFKNIKYIHIYVKKIYIYIHIYRYNVDYYDYYCYIKVNIVI